jgi:hypothetical protein
VLCVTAMSSCPNDLVYVQVVLDLGYPWFLGGYYAVVGCR